MSNTPLDSVMASNNSLILSDPPITVGSRPTASIYGPVFGTVRGEPLTQSRCCCLQKRFFPLGALLPRYWP
ncbi:hypothetical protein BDZ97DRAFT_2082894 [Flammula alnicola]|nr:hypothetical protein BDZ97DRAFT_2082894 [Flammula alnicola]